MSTAPQQQPAPTRSDPPARKGSRLLRLAGASLAILAALGAAGIATAAFQERAVLRSEASAQPPTPLPVATTRLVPETGYAIDERFAGRVEPARRTMLAFERAGTLVAVAVEEGARVEAGDLIARLDTRSLEAEEVRLSARLEEARAALDLARLTLARQDALSDRGHASAQRLDEARLAERVEAARLAEIEAALASLAVDLDKAVLRAPFAGTVGARRVDEGAVVAPGAAVVEILESGRERVRIGLSREAAAGLSPGAGLSIEIAGRFHPARVSALRPDLDGATRTLTALLELDRPSGAPAGEITTLTIPRRVDEPGIWVPLASLTEGRRGLWSLLVASSEDGAARIAREPVEVLHVEGTRAFVRGAFAPGTALVAEGPHRITPGQRVALREGGGR